MEAIFSSCCQPRKFSPQPDVVCAQELPPVFPALARQLILLFRARSGISIIAALMISAKASRVSPGRSAAWEPTTPTIARGSDRRLKRWVVSRTTIASTSVVEISVGQNLSSSSPAAGRRGQKSNVRHEILHLTDAFYRQAKAVIGAAAAHVTLILQVSSSRLTVVRCRPLNSPACRPWPRHRIYLTNLITIIPGSIRGPFCNLGRRILACISSKISR